ncbi:MAG: Isoquinoline 1-oxidoreductase subunit, partial [Deltaproteobacteria bacterium]|nr:Isoquinoline 1-oxidoreductase subunit [Nannocystaceae bacterium]
ELRAPSDFTSIADPDARAAALFVEATRVMQHPRCANCHPDGDSPLQGMDMQLHDPPVFRGPDDHGVAGLECTSCHQDRNLELARVPGAPKWALAPIEMAWVNRSPHALCEQVKDPARNGGKDLAQIVEHSAHDELVAWGWAPGHDRQPAPGTQQEFGALMAAWVDAGAACPPEETKP